MRIESGFGKFNVGEEVTVQLLEVKYTKNHKPYARVLAEGAEQSFNVNIKEADARLPRGRYKLVCTGVTDAGFCYVDFRKIQHPSWDKRDEVLSEHEEHVDNVSEELEKVEQLMVVNDCIPDMVFSIQLTKQYLEKMKYITPSIREHVEGILSELYEHYGKLVVDELEGVEEIELS